MQPLIMWLQGGPGASGTGYGNFEEMGPLDTNLNYRNTTWVTAANVIYVDNPVGAGFSYVDDASLYTTNNTQIAADLVTLMQAFLTKYPAFQTTPFFVFCESYGGLCVTLCCHRQFAVQFTVVPAARLVDSIIVIAAFVDHARRPLKLARSLLLLILSPQAER